VRHVFVTKYRAEFPFSSVFQNYFNFVPLLESRNMDHVKSICSWDIFLRIILTLYPCQNHEMWITWKVIFRETCFCEKIMVYFTVSWVLQKYFNFVPMLESRNVDHARLLPVNSIFILRFRPKKQQFSVALPTP